MLIPPLKGVRGMFFWDRGNLYRRLNIPLTPFKGGILYGILS
jgi:hypothetical protein